MFADDEPLCRWIRLAAERVAFQGLPARIFWLGYGERARFGLAINDLVRRGVVKAPIVIGRDHLDTGSVASPNRETEGMRDGSDAIADWPVLNALLNTSSGATWVSVHHGGGVGIGYSLHAGMVIVADGTREADEKLQRVLTCDPGIGVVRHADAGYPDAMATARESGIDMPMFPRPERRTRPMMIPERPRWSAACSRALDGSGRIRAAIPVVLGGCGSGRTSLLLRLRDLIGRTQAQYVDVERIATTPERFLKALRAVVAVPGARLRPGPRRGAAAPATRSTRRWRCSTRRARPADDAGDVPARRVPRAAARSRASRACAACCATSIGALASSGNRFVLTSRYVARAHRLLRDAPAQFEIIHVAPLGAAEIRATLPGAHADERGTGMPTMEEEVERERDELARLVQALSDGRPVVRAGDRRNRRRRCRRAAPPIRSARSPRCSRPAASSRRRCRFCYELRLHRARGYGALKAILEVLAQEEPLTLTEIAQRLHRTPGIDQGLPLVARGRRPDRVAAEALQLRRPDAAAVGAAALPRRAAGRRRHRARAARLRAGAAAARRAGAGAGRQPGRDWRRAREELGESSRSIAVAQVA